ncbi:hypothetical protein ACLB2K_042674 [Fragaria x ananassa]
MAAKPFFFFLSLLPLLVTASNPDSTPLLAFKATSDASNLLATWSSTSNPCNFAGASCTRNRVSRLVLEGLDLRGSFAALTGLTHLRVLSLKRNRLSGPIPDLSNLNSLKLLFLSYNDFSGEFPASLTSLFRLYRLDLAYNNLTGEIPETVNHLTHLLTLLLEANRFSGSISGINLPNLQEFNVSANRLYGEIPKSVSIFSESAFAENPGLCGAPVHSCKTVTNPTRPGSGGSIASAVMAAVVASSPTSLPSSSTSVN